MKKGEINIVILLAVFASAVCMRVGDVAQWNLAVVEKGTNITEEMEQGILKSIKDSALNCTIDDRSCFTQIVGMKIEALFGKSWNVHLVEKTTTVIKGRQYSHDRWITIINEGVPAFSYYIFKPIDCSKPFATNT